VRILLDYRPALRARSGVGEYVHELTRALALQPAGDHISIFSSSWKDRPDERLRDELANVQIIDRRIPVRGLTWAWHQLGWPPIELLAGEVDVVHAQTPLLIPARRAAQVITIHDLDFLHHPERFDAEMRRDFPRLVRDHARRADHLVVSSHYAAREVVQHLEVPPEKVSVCSPGAPDWAFAIARERSDMTSSSGLGRHVLFVGTLEARKNIGVLLDAYARLRERDRDAPPLVLAGRARADVARALQRIDEAPLAGHVSMRGYVSDAERRVLYREARLLVLPSLEEGFGLPVLEAMACGVPVVVSNRGALPEVVSDAASPIDPTQPDQLADEMARLLQPAIAREAIARGLAQAARFSWAACAVAARDAYKSALAQRERRGR
jgi:glycosyltransferase involved in cell wall biosynthesis